MRKAIIGLMAGLLACGTQVSAKDDIATMEKKFKDTPKSQRLSAYWYWISGNISKDGVVKDLRAMNEAGINRVQIGMTGEGQGAPEGPVRMFSDEWWDILDTMFVTASELDIEVGLFNCPGWSQSGGPWVKPSQSMRYLGYAKDTLTGPSKFMGRLPEVGPDARDVRILAYPLVGRTSFRTLGLVPESRTVFFKSESEAAARSLTLRPVGKRLKASAELSDIPAVERYAEKSLAKMWQTPHPMWDAYLWREQPKYEGIDPSEVLDLTDKMDSEGNLSWDVPAGDWVVTRAAMLPTGVTNSPCPCRGQGPGDRQDERGTHKGPFRQLHWENSRTDTRRPQENVQGNR